MKVGLDWDGTVNADPVAFKGVVESLLDTGHDVTVTTWRSPPEGYDNYPDIEEIFAMWGFKLPVVYCSGKAKRDCYPADIWIDDNPASVVFTLAAEPRFVENPADYDNDVLLLESEGHETIRVLWSQLKPKGRHLVSPVNFKGE